MRVREEKWVVRKRDRMSEKGGKSSRTGPPSSEGNPVVTHEEAKLIAKTILANSMDALEEPVEAESWVAADGRVAVYQIPVEQPRFIILSNYPLLRQVLWDLGMPNVPQAIYYSCFLGGGDYTNTTGETYRKSQLFTVELFGRFLDSVVPEDVERELPKRWQPNFWNDSTCEDVAIWRTRVYSQPLTRLRLAPPQPMSPYSPSFPYLERRWVPARDRDVLLLGGLEGFSGGFSLLNKFYQRASSILYGAPARWGRVPMDATEFYKVVVRVHNKLWIRDGIKPGQKQVALEMGLNLNTFRSRWKKTEANWDDIPGPFDGAKEM